VPLPAARPWDPGWSDNQAFGIVAIQALGLSDLRGPENHAQSAATVLGADLRKRSETTALAPSNPADVVAIVKYNVKALKRVKLRVRRAGWEVGMLRYTWGSRRLERCID
jgi:hypothetical protein